MAPYESTKNVLVVFGCVLPANLNPKSESKKLAKNGKVLDTEHSQPKLK